MTEPVAKRADQIVVGDRIPDEHLPYRFHKGPAEVNLVADDGLDDKGVAYTFLAYRYPNGRHESHTARSDAVLNVFPADTGLGYSRADDGEVTQPIAGRVPSHHENARTGEVVELPPRVVGGFEVDPNVADL